MAENEAGAAAVAPSAPSPPCTLRYCSQLVSERPAGIAPWHSVRIVDVSLGIFNTRLHLRLPNVISGTTVACATVTCPQASQPPLSLPSFPPFLPFLAPFCSVNRSSLSSAMDPSGPMGDCCYRWAYAISCVQLAPRLSVCECECECVFTPILMPALTHIRCGNCDCALHLERMQKQTFYLSNICCMFSSFFLQPVLINSQSPGSWSRVCTQTGTGIWTETGRVTSADFAQTVHKLIICRCKWKVSRGYIRTNGHMLNYNWTVL